MLITVHAFVAVTNVLITQLVFSEDMMEALEEAKAVSTLTFTHVIVNHSTIKRRKV